MAEESHCPQCGAELPADAPQGLCPQCLMKLGLPTGAEPDKAGASEPTSDVPTSATPPGGFVPPEPAELAKQFPQLELLELLGQGGMGAVYKARQKQLDRLVALKILPPQVAQTEAFAERFTREARSLARLNHPRIVSVYDFGHTEDGLYYFIMEFIDGTDLRHVIQAGELSPAEALAIVPQVCEALQFAHEEGIVHRDIKPENILLDKKGRVKIADFGLAKLLDQPATVYTLTQAGQRMGTPHYMAPEQIEHPGQVDHRADIYSLGVVFYEMLTGELPLGRFPLPSKKVHVDVRLDEVVLKTLEKEPELRYQQASEVKIDVETIASKGRTSGSAGRVFGGVKAGEGIGAIRHRVWIPAVGLLIAGALDCLAVVGALIGGMLLLIRGSFSGEVIGFLPGSAQVVIVALMAVYSVFVVLGAWNLMQLRSYRTALAGSLLALFPFAPGAIIGVPMGIWALVLMTKEKVKAAFGQEETEVTIPPKVRDFTVSAAKDMKDVFSRGRAEVEKLLSEKGPGSEQPDAGVPVKTRPMAVGSFVLGFVSILFVSAGWGFAQKFVFVFLSAFFAIFLGVMAMKNIKSYRDRFLDTALAIIGIVIASVSAIKLFTGLK
ncbi:MAG TPA: serine/threonine-protein kinase [Sedimentisphaerales bacterium]|nr:serine/threonine-protein kinase [Sedimentisphaerales bacterium]